MKIHTVKEGETVFHIARKYGVSPAKIIENNGLLNPDRLSVGQKLLIVRPLTNMEEKGDFVAIDNVGAGIGETVLVAKGSAARVGCGLSEAPVDAAIVGIVDEN